MEGFLFNSQLVKKAAIEFWDRQEKDGRFLVALSVDTIEEGETFLYSIEMFVDAYAEVEADRDDISAYVFVSLANYNNAVCQFAYDEHTLPPLNRHELENLFNYYEDQFSEALDFLGDDAINSYGDDPDYEMCEETGRWVRC